MARPLQKIDLPGKKPTSPGNYMSDGFKTMTKTGEPRSISDAELVQRIRRGNLPAFHELVDRYVDFLFGLASSPLRKDMQTVRDSCFAE